MLLSLVIFDSSFFWQRIYNFINRKRVLNFEKMHKCLMFCWLLTPIIFNAQQADLITYLNDSIKETSGLIYLDGRLITHNDSGGAATLYEVDTNSGGILRETIVANASNVDWEDICYDSNYIYIGDFGNNSGSRMNLCIYRLLISDYLTTSNDTIYADTILFNYADQTDFTPTTFATNFDAETLLSIGDSLWIFTKNWSDYKTNIYAIPKIPGGYSISKIDSIDAQGLVTGGVYNTHVNKVVLTGYTISYPFIIELTDFSGNQFSNGIINRNPVDLMGSVQLEAIAHLSGDSYYITVEENGVNNAAIFSLNFLSVSNVINEYFPKYKVYPNPASSMIHSNHNACEKLEIYNSEGSLVLVSSDTSINVSRFRKGYYYFRIIGCDAKIKRTKVILLE